MLIVEGNYSTLRPYLHKYYITDMVNKMHLSDRKSSDIIIAKNTSQITFYTIKIRFRVYWGFAFC